MIGMFYLNRPLVAECREYLKISKTGKSDIRHNPVIRDKVGKVSNTDETNCSDILHNLHIPNIQSKADFAEVMREVHFSVACSTNNAIATSQNNTYKLTQMCFQAAIADAYPDVPVSDIYDIWVDCHEDVAYCVNWYKKNKKGESDISVESAIESMSDFTDRGYSLQNPW